MSGLLAALLLLHAGCLVDGACSPFQAGNRSALSGHEVLSLLQSEQPCLNFSGSEVHLPGNASVGAHVKELDLSDTMLRSLPPRLLANAVALQWLSLAGNALKELPPQIFKNTPRLTSLQLPRTPLSLLPTLGHCLGTLTVDCACGVAGSIRHYCQNCSLETACRCASPGGLLNATDFFARRCRGPPPGVYAAAVLPVVALLLVAGLAYFLIQKRRKATFAQDKRTSPGSEGAHGQPRYIQHASPQGDAARGAAGDTSDYANIFLEQPQGARVRHGGQHSCPPGPLEGEQPVYANTQDLYYNYCGPVGNSPEALEEELYIIPDK
ncbi:uncharacterized protein LOC123036609 [Varanus komodoensis]|uniref:Uncharacterized protein n=1 Tax=Varanus komodoensis TaxID=61221 RepID=A0A8D2KSH7_VARKO|nr:uncharacterized protein LOC123036609 [Varanus komodoensis]